jgi:DNA-binding transcriptional regulator YbjK
VLEAYLKQYALQGRLQQQRLIDDWESVMGSTVAARTRRIWMEGTVLHIELTSAPLRTQLVQSTARVLEILQQHAGAAAITEIVFR